MKGAEVWRAVVAASAGDLRRRRTALVLLVALPFAVYAGTESAVFLVLVAGWAMATLALFSWVHARDVERRLAIVGVPPGWLFTGRAAALGGLALLVAAAGGALVGATHRDAARPWALVGAAFVACLLAVPFGALVGQLLPREMEGALTVMVLMAVQFAVAGTEGTSWRRILPLDGPSRLVDYGYSARFGTSDALAALAQSGVAALVLTAAAAAVAGWRLRPADMAAVAAGTDAAGVAGTAATP